MEKNAALDISDFYDKFDGQIKKIEEEKARLKLLENDCYAALSKNIRECDHVIVLLGFYFDSEDQYTEVSRCLICGVDTDDMLNGNNLPKPVIDATNYEKEKFNMHNRQDVEEKYSIIREMFIKELKESENVSQAIESVSDILNKKIVKTRKK